jgi:hypothetical protein
MTSREERRARQAPRERDTATLPPERIDALVQEGRRLRHDVCRELRALLRTEERELRVRIQ